MKFTEHLAAHITPEWRKQYILYEVSAVGFLRICCTTVDSSVKRVTATPYALPVGVDTNFVTSH